MTTRDEITAARKRRRRSRRMKRIGFYLLFLIVVLTALVLLSFVNEALFHRLSDSWKTMTAGGSFPVSYLGSAPLQVETMNGSFVILSEEELRVYSQRGAELQSLNHGFHDPTIRISETGFVLFSRGSYKTAFYSRTELLYTVSEESRIIDAATSSRYSTVLCESERFTAEAVFYNELWEEVFRWECANGFPYTVLLDDKGENVLVFALILSDRGVQTTVYGIDAERREEVFALTVDGIASRAVFCGTNDYLILSNEGIHAVSDGVLTDCYNFNHIPVIDFSYDNKDRAVIALGSNSQPAVNELLFVTKDLDVLFRIPFPDEVRDVMASRGKIYVLSDGYVAVYNLDGDQLEIIETEHNVVSLAGNGNTPVVVMPGGADKLM